MTAYAGTFPPTAEIVGKMRYSLVAIDVDGTLLGPDHRLDGAAVDAIRQARAAGVRTVLATGRSYDETIDIWRRLALDGPYEPMVLVGGALVTEPDTGRTLYQKPLPLADACEFADALVEAGYTPMALVDKWRYGFDYLLMDAADVSAARRDWLDKTGAEVRTVSNFADVPDGPELLRVSAVAGQEDANALATRLGEAFRGRLNIHAILAPNYGVTAVEAFAYSASKFTALRYVAQAWRLGPGSIASIGDDVNDLAMIRQAALGAAMPNAPDEVVAAADVVASDGLSGFLLDLTAGKFN